MKHNAGRLIINLIIGAFVLIASFGAFLYRWTFSTWVNLQMNELIYELSASLEGTSSELILDGVMSVVFPCMIAVLLYALLLSLISRKVPRIRKPYLVLCLTASIVTLVISLSKASKRLDFAEHIQGTQTESTFIEDHYVSPADVKLTFPEKKRNLIYIFLESMETTWMDKASGGQFEKNVIPELTRISAANECFAGENGRVNGAHSLSGTSWTMGAMFAHTAGLPLKINIGNNSMNKQETFFPGIVAMGDVLENEGYKQVLLIGSDATFGGRRLYFTQHGNYEMHDYAHAVIEGRIPQDHYVWWGYEDFYLFNNAKEELLNLAQQDEPFNLTMLTVDTHKEDGYLCEYCPDVYGEDRYSNVNACSSRQVAEFVEWIKQQAFYENTTIVIVGDHLTMDADYANGIDMEDRRVYTAFLNSAAESGEKREYSTYDLFPTTLAAMGVEIEGNRLGLGSNLYSDEPTLIERYGVEHINSETNKRSHFMEAAGRIKEYGENAVIEINQGQNDNEIRICVKDILACKDIKRVSAKIWNETGKVQNIPMKLQPDGSYEAYADISGYERSYGHLEIEVVDSKKNSISVGMISGNLKISSRDNIESYLEGLMQLDQCSILIAAQDDASYSLSEDTKDSLKMLGLQANWKELFRQSYYAVIEPEKVTEKYDRLTVTKAGILFDGKPYFIRSSGFETGGSACSIMIDGQEYAPNSRGMNIVVYDHVLGKVVSTAVYDTCLNAPSAQMSVECGFTGRLKVRITDVQTIASTSEIYVEYWNQDNPEKKYRKKLDSIEEGVYTLETGLPLFMAGNGYLAAYAVDSENKTYRVAEGEF